MGERSGRFELKYLIGKKDYYLLKQLLPRVLKIDPNNSGGEFYTVSSIYFDDPFDTSFYEKVDGVFERKKFRIRYYDHSDAFIKLEKKEKIGGITYKTDMRIDKSIVMTALRDPLYLNINAYDHSLYKDFVIDCKSRRLTPKVVVQYKREAYLLNYEGIRICFDAHIKSSLPSEDLFTKKPASNPIMTEPLYVFEVKYKRFLPNYIRELIQVIDTTQTAFSKYSLSRLQLDRSFKFTR
ncbi:polyphosphate polymerase domain-containing protein [Fusibacter sp. JL216-2]|uniref:polyphosphate polymerase domain-containing protein n=1 Tax=Fusibacter sp. JL216-2 TaxID=3071453 RepID=UPI003D345482